MNTEFDSVNSLLLVLVFDMSDAPMPNLSYQLKQAPWMKRNDLLIKKYCQGVAYVIPRAVFA